MTSRLTLAFLLLFSGNAAAQSAKQLVKEGAALYNAQRYADAILRYQAAYERDSRLSRVLLLIGVAHMNLHQAEEALTAYESYEEKAGPQTPAEREQLTAYYDEAARKFLADHARPQARLELLLLAGRAFLRTGSAGHLEQAGALLLRYQREVPVPPERYQRLLERSLREHRERTLQEALASLARGGPRREVLLRVADAHLQLGHLEDALDGYDQVREGAPASAEDGALRDGYRTLVARLQAGDAGPGVDLLLGRAYFGLDQLDEAAVRYRRVQEGAPPASPQRLVRYLRDLAVRRAALASQRPAPAPEPPKVVQPSPLAPPTPPTPVFTELPRSRWKQWTGVPLVAAGGFLVGAGLAGVALDGRCTDGRRPCDGVYDSLGQGIGMTAAGLVCIGGGVVLLGLEVRQRQRGARRTAGQTVPRGGAASLVLSW